MPVHESLDTLINRYAAEFADHVRQAATMADTEADIRIEVEKQLTVIQNKFGIKLSGKHEVTVASGRADSVYQRVVIEYKNPASPSARIGDTLDAAGTKKVVDQIRSRLGNLQADLGHPIESLFGVGCDGRRFVFVRWRDKQWHVDPPVEVDVNSAKRFLWALFNLGLKGRPFNPDYLAGDFGSDAPLAQHAVATLYQAIVKATHPKAKTLFQQWKILFGEVCGYDVAAPSDKVKKLAKHYGITGKLHPPELLFAVHTYYALFMKLLASTVVASFHRVPTPLAKLVAATKPAKFKAEIDDLEQGSIFRVLGITNFLEGDLFAWYVPVWSDAIEQVIREMVAKLDTYNPTTLAEDPAGSRDLLKKLYQQLFPKSVRHDLGEYYTPDWLAEHTLNEVGYDGDPDKRVLDPACGSGTFLVMAINRVRRWYADHREQCGYEEDDLARKIISNVVGFDLNPLAVMAARTNYLIAIRDLIERLDKIEIPVYLCDSILTPSSHGGLFAGTTDAAKELKTAAAKFLIPTEIAQSREDVGRYAEQIEFCVKNGYGPKEFVERCADEGLAVSEKTLHVGLYKELVALDKANKNGVWARIIKNSFAPLFVGRMDFVVGNPPWVNWESLPREYRDDTVKLWDTYRLRERAIRGSRLGNVKRELSALFVYVSMDCYLRDRGVLGFVITQTVLKTGANEGFRRFRLDSDRPVSVNRVIDMSFFLPFDGAVNRTAVIVATNGLETKYPVDYQVWVPKKSFTDSSADSPATAEAFHVHLWRASPCEPSVRESAWLTGPSSAFATMRKIVGDRSKAMMERTYAGSCTWMNGVFWVDVLRQKGGSVVIRNRAEIGKRKVGQVECAVEEGLVYPLLRGRDVLAWRALPSGHLIVPHLPDSFESAIPLATMKRAYPKTFGYLRSFEAELRSRSGYKQLFDERDPFYVIGNVGSYTLTQHKVVFKELTDMFQCAVVGPVALDGEVVRPVIPDHKLLFVAAASDDEAHYLAGVLNSSPCRVALFGASTGVQTQSYYPTDVSRIRIPTFDPSKAAHRAIVELSRECHASAESGGGHGALAAKEDELAGAVGELWGISNDDRKAMARAYSELVALRSGRATDEEAE